MLFGEVVEADLVEGRPGDPFGAVGRRGDGRRRWISSIGTSRTPACVQA
ncbi:hypothetical protein ABT218_37575 [Streptomyces sp. NPDC001455]